MNKIDYNSKDFMLLKLTLKDMGFFLMHSERHLFVYKKGKFFFKDLKIGKLELSTGTYYLYGLPKTNKEIIDLFSGLLQYEVQSIKLFQDHPQKDFGYHPCL